MIAPEGVWATLDRLALERGFTPSALARAAGLDATTFNPSRRVGAGGAFRWPSVNSLLRALEVLNVPLAVFAAYLEGGEGAGGIAPGVLPGMPKGMPMGATLNTPSGIGSGHPQGAAQMGRPVRSLPFSQLGQSGLFDRQGHPTGPAWDEQDCPFNIAAPAYMVRIDTAHMEPVLREGASAVVVPGLAPRAQDRAVLLRAGDEPCAGFVRGGESLSIEPFAAPWRVISLAPGRDVWLHRIVMVTL
ncbi:helix-turn-helix transcriptional regulator [Acetobacter sp. TBRC 12305]|uniref:Helix-turn-helix transcriptional regulator n=1 Tax=Acetobacter garciniae TaxID=2817435 RepID=A0A939KPA4_9PROT|nr:helix-turn-helix transcriptional regulator [Acetobacter garciniae]MBO1323652.1 helix-turn-helix transcriptional regulator [Acetobacter garciniae]MBX0343341.1 helix-turn-helix transcriptional regulator [Acetobacter garciniae]